MKRIDQCALLDVLRLVHAGLLNGSVKSKPIISFGRDAETADMQSLEEIIANVLAKCAHGIRSKASSK